LGILKTIQQNEYIQSIVMLLEQISSVTCYNSWYIWFTRSRLAN